MHGFITREKVKEILGTVSLFIYKKHVDLNVLKDIIHSEGSYTSNMPSYIFKRESSGDSTKNFYYLLDEAPMELNKQVPQEFVVSMFQKMVRLVYFW